MFVVSLLSFRAGLVVADVFGDDQRFTISDDGRAAGKHNSPVSFDYIKLQNIYASFFMLFFAIIFYSV